MAVGAAQTLARGAKLNEDKQRATRAGQTTTDSAESAPAPAWTKSFNEPGAAPNVTAPSPALNVPAQSTSTSAVDQDQKNQATLNAKHNAARQAATQKKSRTKEEVADETSAKSKTADKLQAPSRYALKTAWLALLETFGLSLIYIDFHWIFSKIPLFSSFFAEPGQEWLPETMPLDQRKKAGISLGLWEKIGIVLLNLLIIAVFGIVITLFLVQIWCITSPVQCGIEALKLIAS